MKTYKIVLRLNDYESPVWEVEAGSWKILCEYIFGHIEIIDTEE